MIIIFIAQYFQTIQTRFVFSSFFQHILMNQPVPELECQRILRLDICGIQFSFAGPKDNEPTHT